MDLFQACLLNTDFSNIELFKQKYTAYTSSSIYMHIYVKTRSCAAIHMHTKIMYMCILFPSLHINIAVHTTRPNFISPATKSHTSLHHPLITHINTISPRPTLTVHSAHLISLLGLPALVLSSRRTLPYFAYQ